MRNKNLSAAFAKFAMPVVLLLLILCMQLLRPDANLLSVENIKTIFLQTSVLGFLALGLSEGQNRLILGENFLRLFGAGGQNPQPAPARIG